MSEDERLAWARLVSGRAIESHRLWCRYYDDRASLTDDERADVALQCALVRVLWRGPGHVALAAIGCLGDTFAAESPVAAVDALGLVMCHVAALAEISELTMPAAIALALQRLIDGDVPLLPSSDLARSLPFHGEHALSARLDALAGVVARAMDDVHINHGVEVKPMELYRRIADEVIAGRMPAKPERDPLELRYSLERQLVPAPRPEFDRRAQAIEQLRDAVSDAMEAQRGSRFSDGLAAMMEREYAAAKTGDQRGDVTLTTTIDTTPIFDGLTREALAAQAAEVNGAIGRLIESELAAWHQHMDAKERALWDHGYGGKSPSDPAQIVGLTAPGSVKVLSYEERERALDELVRMTEDMGGYPELDNPVPGLAGQRICPQCAGLLSERGDGMLACPSQHEFTAQQLQALNRASTAGEPTG